MLEIQSIAIELADARRGNHNAMRILERQDIQRSVHGIAKRLFFVPFLSAFDLAPKKKKATEKRRTVVSRLSGAEFHMSM